MSNMPCQGDLGEERGGGNARRRCNSLILSGDGEAAATLGAMRLEGPGERHGKKEKAAMSETMRATIRARESKG